MRSLFEFVVDCVEGNTLDAVDAAVNKSTERLFEKIVNRYPEIQLPKEPTKNLGEFVPGWLIDSIEIGGDPYGYDLWFTCRAILYSHRVAHRNPLYYWVHPLTGSPTPPHDIRETLHKILMYGELELTGLLFYADPTIKAEYDIEVTDADVRAYYDQYLAPQSALEVGDWSVDSRDTFLARVAAEQDLVFGLPSVRQAFEWARINSESLDLYVPEIPMYRNAYEWLIRKSGFGVLGSKSHDAYAAMAPLWSLPTPSAPEFNRLTAEDLLEIRHDNVFSHWRDALQAATAGLAAEDAVGRPDRGVAEFARIIASEKDRVIRKSSNLSVIRRSANETGHFGFSLALGAMTGGGTGAMFGQDIDAAAAGGAAGILAAAASTFAPAISHAMHTGRRNRAIARHFDLFALG